MDEDSALLKLIEYGSLSDLKKALRIYQVDARDNNEMTLLAWAAIKGDEKKVSYLLQNGANPNIQNKDGMTPLMYAASNNHTNIVKCLLDANADPHIGDISGWTAETWASVTWSEKSRLLLRAYRKKITDQPFLGRYPNTPQNREKD